jgi:pimeloyl-ACP methyl ester carboxylesterase
VRPEAHDPVLWHARSGDAGPPLVLVHGGFGDHTDWEHQAAALAPDWSVVRPDLPGHGRSPARSAGEYTVAGAASRVLDLLSALSAAPAVLVGHSFSCRVVLEAHRLRPDLVRALVLVDGSCVGVRGVTAARQPFLGAQTDRRARIRATYEAMFFEGVDARLRTRLLDRLDAFEPAAIDALQQAALEWDATEVHGALAAVDVPLLALQSTSLAPDGTRVQLREGESCPWLDLLRQFVPGAQVAIVPGVGHFSMLEAPEAVTSALGAFLRRLPEPGRSPGA